MMDKMKFLAAWLVVLGGFLLGKFDGLMWALVTFIVLDYLTGVLAAVSRKELSSQIGAKGIAKKLLIFVIIIIANIVDVQVIGESHVLRSITVMFYIANESISILENAGSMGVPVPKKILSVLEQLKDRQDKS
jgi:toxin secretion/phage lysis holin